MNKLTSQSEFDSLAQLASTGHAFKWGKSERYGEPLLIIYGDLTVDVKGAFHLGVDNGVIRSNVDIGDNTIEFVGDDMRADSGIEIEDKEIKAGDIIFSSESDNKIIKGSGRILLTNHMTAETASVVGEGLLIDVEKNVYIDEIFGDIKIVAGEVDMHHFDHVLKDPNDNKLPIVIAKKISIEEEAYGHGKFIATKEISLWDKYGDGLRMFSLGSVEAFWSARDSDMDEMTYVLGADIENMGVFYSEKLQAITSYPLCCESSSNIVERLKDASPITMYGINESERIVLQNDYGVSKDTLSKHGVSQLPLGFRDFIREGIETVRKHFGDEALADHQNLITEVNADVARRNGLGDRLPKQKL